MNATTHGVAPYPLYWPLHHKRTEPHARRDARFVVDFSAARNDLSLELQRLDTVPGLTEAERAQALTTLGAHQTMRNLMTSGILDRPTSTENVECPECRKPWIDCPHQPPSGGRRERE